MTPTSKRCRLDCARGAPLARPDHHIYCASSAPMSLPIHSPLATARPTTLSQAVAQVRHPRNHATAQLEPHREELLRLAQAGESAESLVGGLRLIGIEIGRETMRRWLQRELGRRPAKQSLRQKPVRGSRIGVISTPTNPVAPGPVLAPVAPADRAVASASPTTPTMPHTSAARGGANDPVPQGTRFIRPGETPLEAWRRRQAEAGAATHDTGAATEGGQGKPIATPPA